MSEEPKITARKLAHYLPVVSLGTDDQGRQLYQCPNWGCGDTAYFDEQGVGHCISCESMLARLMEMLGDVGGVA